MGDLVDLDQEHLRLLKWCYYLNAGTIAFVSIFSILYILMGSMMASGTLPTRPGYAENPVWMGKIFVAMGVGFLVLGMLTAGLTFYAAVSLRHHRHRIYCMVIGALMCVQIPYGTALGVATIMVLSRPSVKALFEPQAAPRAIE